MGKTLLKKLGIRKFRALTNVDIDFGTHVTVICGKNGTSKSSILGVAAQIFSFETDYTTGASLQFQTIPGGKFKSLPSEHFRFSDKFDIAGSMDVHVQLFDGYTENIVEAELELSKRGKVARPVVRKNSSATGGNASRNFTHPVIFLSLKRLLPIAPRDYQVQSFDYLNSNKQRFLNLTNELLNKTSSVATSTAGSIHSTVAHGENYDQDSVSAGEDNAGQIMLALMSFRKLKQEYTDYKGGLLLIDEADAGLFPAAQIKLVEILSRECQELDLQVVMTSHSPSLIEYTFEQSRKYQRRFKTVYLSDTYGDVQAMHDMSWVDINADLHTKTVAVTPNISLPRINIYFEDREGFDLFGALLHRKPIKKFTNPLDSITLGCSNYIQLVRKGIPEFSSKSIICLDADVENVTQHPSIVLLPGRLPPDQLIFEYLYNLPASHDLWTNPMRFNRPVFTRIAGPLMAALSISGPPVDLKALVLATRTSDPGGKKLREHFKDFYKEANFQLFLGQRNSKLNPWRAWARENATECEAFMARFTSQMTKTMSKGYYVDSAKLVALAGS